MNITPGPPPHDNSVRVRLGRVDSVDLYEIKDSELDLLEKGSPAGTYLNFAVFLLSIAFAAISTLCTATFKHSTTNTIYIVVSVVGVLGGIFLLVLWFRTRASVSVTVKQIRSRIPPEAQEPPRGNVSPSPESQPTVAPPKD